jgi:hypothetical protein
MAGTCGGRPARSAMPGETMASKRRSSRDEVVRVQQMLDYVLQHLRTRQDSLDDAHAGMLFGRARDALRELQQDFAAYGRAVGAPPVHGTDSTRPH